MITAAPQTPKGLATRNRLIICAREEAVRTGGHVEVATVARDAGVVPALINRYFGTKGGLVSAVVDEFFDRLHAEVLDRHLDEEGAWATHERQRLELGVDFHFADPFAVVLYSSLGRDPEVARTESERIGLVIERGASNIRRAQKRGELGSDLDPEIASAAMFGSIRQVMVAALGRPRRPSRQRVVDALWRQIAAAVELDPSQHPRDRGVPDG